MKILYLSNNHDLDSLYFFIKKQKDVDEVIYCSKRTEKSFLIKLDPDIIISYGYRFIIKSDIIKKYSNQIINLHISYLPFNRGADPNIWSILENTIKGVTIHFIDEGIDTGDILFQKEVRYDENNHTLASSYNLLQYEIQKMFIDNWDKIINNEFDPIKQTGSGSIHYIKDFELIKSRLLEEKGWNIPIKELKNRYKKLLKEKL